MYAYIDEMEKRFADAERAKAVLAEAEDDEDVASVVYIEYDGKYYMVENGVTADATEAELPVCNKSFVGDRAFEKLADAHAYDGDADTDCNNCGAARS